MGLLFALAAFTAGGLIVISSVLNAQIAKKIGIYKSAFINNSLAMMTALLLTMIFYADLGGEVQGMGEAPLWSFFGGILTVAIVIMSNIIIPKIPVVYTVLLIFTGQFVMGTVIDTLNTIPLYTNKLLGFLLIISGLVFNIYIDNREGSRSIE
ncbi:DMT family transporter [Natronincola ferrireducens]|uniref:Transporter family-2 protein n=1 Tax=Natronincola ferrireducens TaxID=393762 RepID=A0A1G9F8J2_9FIRM|nr:DMT family transporter [Natronincola ferrireducens]SDK84714.1 transporter family-2 protein [Natronincola ferrireducens]